MHQQQASLRASDLWLPGEPNLPFVPKCDQAALAQLGKAYRDGLPLVALVGEGRIGAGRVIASFLDSVDGSRDVVRLSRPWKDLTNCMRDVIRNIGFEPRDMSLADLDSIFTMFLSYQRTHGRRTILCVEDAQDVGGWVLDKLCKLVQFEASNHFGLTVVLAGQGGLDQLLYSPPLVSVFSGNGRRIAIAPFELCETREYVRQHMNMEGVDDIGQVFEFQAIDHIHELSIGVPDTVGSLCVQCLRLVDERRDLPVTTSLVEEAARLVSGENTQAGDRAPRAPGGSDAAGRLIARIDGEKIGELTISAERILLGRDKRSDLLIPSCSVSRQHAVVENLPTGVHIVDLGSTNGTYVNGEKIQRYRLTKNEVIVIGNCRIEFVSADYGQDLLNDVDATVMPGEDGRAAEPAATMIDA